MTMTMTAKAFCDWMEAERWSVRRLAAELDVSASTIQRYRNGDQPVPRVVELALRALEAGKR